MLKFKFRKMNLLLILVLFAFLYWLNYIIHSKAEFANYTKGINTVSVSTYELTNGQHDKELVRMDEYAKLCDIVYRCGPNEKLDTFLNWKRMMIPMENVDPEDKSKIRLNGFYYELWELKEIDQTIVAIIFSGTNEFSDWLANFRWIRRLFSKRTWDHYDQLNKISNKIVESIKNNHSVENGKLKIVTAGHSLGGGLAQFMAYSIPEINFVYAFNPSPVTAYYDVKPKSTRIENKKDLVIYRIYESGEGLSFVRTFMTFLYPAPLIFTEDPAFIRIRFSFATGDDSVEQHTMCHLAENLTKCKRDRNYKPDKKFLKSICDCPKKPE